MGDFLYVVKCLGITIVLVLIMQIKVSNRTLEQHSMAWIHQSNFVDNLRMIAEGAVKAVGEGADYARDLAK